MWPGWIRRADGWAGGLALALAMLGAAPLAAQQRSADPDLRALIPDEAVADPQAWAHATGQNAAAQTGTGQTGTGQTGTAPIPAPQPSTDQAPLDQAAASSPAPVGPVASALPDTAAQLRPDSPLDDIPGLTLDWPEGDAILPPVEALAPDPETAAELAQALSTLSTPGAQGIAPRPVAERETVLASGRARLDWPVDTPFPERESLEIRFRSLSALQGLGAHDPDAMAQIVVRGASDRKLIEQLLRVYGYYDGEVVQTLVGAEAIRFDVQPGARYRLGAITTGDLDKTGADAAPLRAALGLAAGDPLNLDTITDHVGRLGEALGRRGYPFADTGTPALSVDHARFEGDLDLPVKPGGKYRYGAITTNLPHYMSPGHLGDMARFHPGDVYDRDKVDDFRRAILATGLVSSLTVTPRETAPPSGEQPGTVALDVSIVRAPQRTLAGEIGYDTGEGFRVASSWEHRNLFPPEGSLKFRTILGTNEQLVGSTFRRANFLGRDRQLSVDIYADNANLTAYAARKLAFATTYERLTTILFQKPWSWSMGLEAQASEEREGISSGLTTGRILYITTALPLRAAIDSTDDLLDPHRGHRAALRISPELALARGKQEPYARIQLDASSYVALGKTVMAGRIRLGSMPGTDIDNVAPSRRFYAGGGASIRGYGYDLVGPRNALGDPKGGRSLYEFSIEARIPTGLFQGALQVVPFLDAGGVETGSVPHFNDWRLGAGLGLRYRTGFGPIRIDLGTPLNPRAGDGPIGVYVALGQAF